MSHPSPDIVLVLTTQWRGSALGCAGDPNARTPNLDALAAESLFLRQAVTPHPFGVFARAALLTGRASPNNGIRDYYDPLPAASRTLAHAFRDAGYETSFFGKWQLYERDPQAKVVGKEHARIVVPPARRGGFEFWEGFESGFLLNDPLLHGTEIARPTRFRGYQSDVMVERFCRYVASRAAGTRPLFSVISLDAPHPPYREPAGEVSLYEVDELRLLEGTTEDRKSRSAALLELTGYYAHIEATDRALGRLIDEIKSAGRWENTLFVFASAHGDMHGVSDCFRKGWPHEESVRVPLIVSWPDRLPASEDDALLFSLLDLGPTLLSMAVGSNLPHGSALGFEGQDLWKAIKGSVSGPEYQEISMPSVPPFAQQCPYVWRARRTKESTMVYPQGGEPFELLHADPRRFEDAESRRE